MSETKHTPGPWKITYIKNRPYIFQAAFSNYDKFAIARIQNDEVGDVKANSHLIAAAPELYDLLDECRYNASMPKGLLEDIEKVLKKARGESNG